MNYKRIIPGGNSKLNFLTALLYLPKVALALLTIKSTAYNYSKFKKNVLIIGNGPSLTKDIEDNIDNLQKADLMVTNFFGSSSYFQKLKPLHYMLADSFFWEIITPNSLHVNDSSVLNIRNKVLSLINILNSVEWKIILHLPNKAKSNTDFLNLIENPNISFSFFNDTKMIGYPPITFRIYKRRWAIPSLQNVLVPSLVCAINMNYKNIALVGFDHSWITSLAVDNNNQVYKTDSHFYKEETKKQLHIRNKFQNNKLIQSTPSLAKHYFAFASLLDYYKYIQKYAEYRSVEIINCTSDSFIDAFKKSNLQSILSESDPD